MGIRFYCPNGHKLNVKEFQAGRKGICPYCGAKVRIPLESTRPSSKELRSARQPAMAAAGASAAPVAQPPTSPVPGGEPAARGAGAGTTQPSSQPTGQPAGLSSPLGAQEAADQSLQATPLEPLQPIASVAPAQPKGFISAPLSDAQAASSKQLFGAQAAGAQSRLGPSGVGAAGVEPTAAGQQTIAGSAYSSAAVYPSAGSGLAAYGPAMGGHGGQPGVGSSVASTAGAYASTAGPYGAAPATMIPSQPVGGVGGIGDPLTEAGDVVWYVRPPSGGQYGPATRDIMRTWLAEGRISADTLVWREGWRDWQSAGSVFPQLAAAPAFPVLQSTFSPGSLPTYGAGTRRRSRSVQLLIVVVLIIVVLASAAVFLWVLLQGDTTGGSGRPATGPGGAGRVAMVDFQQQRAIGGDLLAESAKLLLQSQQEPQSQQEMVQDIAPPSPTGKLYECTLRIRSPSICTHGTVAGKSHAAEESVLIGWRWAAPAA